MCESNRLLNNEIELVEYINHQTGEKLDLEKVSILKGNAILKLKPEVWCIWDFEKNDELGLDIWKMTRGLHIKAWWHCVFCNESYIKSIFEKMTAQSVYFCTIKKVNHYNSLFYTNKKLSSEWDYDKNQLTPLDYCTGSKKKVYWKCANNHTWEAVIDNRNNNAGYCPYCIGRYAWKGETDMWTTNPELAKLLANPEDGYKYMQSSHVKVDWKCPCCGEIIKDKQISNINKQGLSCGICNKGSSLPERIVSEMLDSLQIEYKRDKSNGWSNNKRYDFYISSLNVIIETHGEQHYRYTGFKKTLEEEQENDKYKYEMAIANGIKPENYIVIDCRYSDLEFIKNNMMNSRLSEMFDLSKIDWIDCFEKASISMHLNILNLRKRGVLIKEISDKLGISKTTVRKVIKKFVAIGACENFADNYSGKAVYQYSLDGKFIHKYISITHATSSTSFYKSRIVKCCNGELESYGGFLWSFYPNTDVEIHY